MQGKARDSSKEEATFSLEMDPTGGLPVCASVPANEASSDWGATVRAERLSGQQTLALKTV